MALKPYLPNGGCRDTTAYFIIQTASYGAVLLQYRHCHVAFIRSNVCFKIYIGVLIVLVHPYLQPFREDIKYITECGF